MIAHNASCYDRVSECGSAYKDRRRRSRHYQGDLFADFPHAAQWLWLSLGDAVDRALAADPSKETALDELRVRVAGIAANARVLIDRLSEGFMTEQPLNAIIGDLDGLHRIADSLLSEVLPK
jgi:hypothetical protein